MVNFPKGFDCPFEKIDDKHQAVVSCSNYVFSRPDDWNENVHQDGYWVLEEAKEYTPDKKLKDFLEAGDKPIYFGFGSVLHDKDKEPMSKVIIDALKITGKRGIISGMGEIKDLSENIIAIGSIPHTWLFDRVSAVCHHGGAGTTAAGFSAGVPSIIVPFANDQFAWAHRAYDLGVGSMPIPRKKITVEALIDAINYVQSNEIIQNAETLSDNIASENGLSESAKIIMNLDSGRED